MNSSMYFETYLDKESPVISETFEDGVSSSFASIDHDDMELSLRSEMILGSSKSETENMEAKETVNAANITGVPSAGRDIFDVLSSAVQQLSEEKSSSDDNRYSILSSSSRLGEDADNNEVRGLLNESFKNLDHDLNGAEEKLCTNPFSKEAYLEDLIESELETEDLIECESGTDDSIRSDSETEDLIASKKENDMIVRESESQDIIGKESENEDMITSERETIDKLGCVSETEYIIEFESENEGLIGSDSETEDMIKCESNARDWIGCKTEIDGFIIAKRLSKDMLLTDNYAAEHESTAEAVKLSPLKKCSVDIVNFQTISQKICEVEPLVPIVAVDCFMKLKNFPVSLNCAKISEFKCKENWCIQVENDSIFNISSSEKNGNQNYDSALYTQDKTLTKALFEQKEGPMTPTLFEQKEEPITPTLFEQKEEPLTTSLFDQKQEAIDTTFFEQKEEPIDSTLFEQNEETITSTLFDLKQETSEAALYEMNDEASTNVINNDEEKHETNENHFIDFELSLAIQNALGIVCYESDHADMIQTSPAHVKRESFNSGQLELIGVSNHQEMEEVMNPAENINLSFGDNNQELLKKDRHVAENVLVNTVECNETLDTSKIMEELTPTSLLECSGDHTAYINNTHEKGLTCRMAAKLMNDVSPNFSTNQLNVDQKQKLINEQRHKNSKRKRSRNVLLSSLKIQLSPEEINKEINHVENCSDKKFNEKSNNIDSETDNSCVDFAIILPKQNRDEIIKEEINAHAFMHEIKPLKSSELLNHINGNLKTNTDDQDNNASSFIHSTVSQEMPILNCEEIGNTARTCKSDLLFNKNICDSFDVTEEIQVRILQVIKKILSFVQREVILYHQNNGYKPKGFRQFVKELWFDYNFQEDEKTGKLFKNEKCFEDIDANLVEPSETEAASGDDINLCICKFNKPEIESTEKNEFSQLNINFENTCNINCEGTKIFNCNSDNSKCGNKTFAKDLENQYEEETNSKVEQSGMLSGMEIIIIDEEDDLKLFQSLDQYLTFKEKIKYRNKMHKPKNTFSPTKNNKGSKNKSDDFLLVKLPNTQENIICSQKTNNCPTVTEPLDDLRRFSSENISLIDVIEKEKILESTNLSSEAGDIGRKESYNFSSCDSNCLKIDISEESHHSSVKPYSSDTDSGSKSTLSEPNSYNHFTIIISPRKNNAMVNSGGNITVKGNTTACTSCLTSPLSIQITREDVNEKERCSLKTRNIDSKTSTEDLCCLHKEFDLKKLERERLRNLELYDFNKSEALKPMKKKTRIIPIHPAESFEFTLSNLHQSMKSSKKSGKHLSKSTKHDSCCLSTSYQRRHKNSKSIGDDVNSYPSSNFDWDHEIDRKHEKIILNKIFSRKYDSTNSQIYDTPVRRKILNASKAIRSPKYSLKLDQSALKGIRNHKSSPRKINGNKAEQYFLDESSLEYKLENRRRSRVLENTSRSEECQKHLSSPFSDYRQQLICTKFPSPTDLNSKFDCKFKRYARRGRNTGDLISYKRSTQWLRDAGIIGQVLTAEEADRAFKCAAGVKVALNKCDYRHFLYKLARLKRLRYSEIYQRLSEVVNELA